VPLGAEWALQLKVEGRARFHESQFENALLHCLYTANGQVGISLSGGFLGDLPGDGDLYVFLRIDTEPTLWTVDGATAQRWMDLEKEQLDREGSDTLLIIQGSVRAVKGTMSTGTPFSIIVQLSPPFRGNLSVSGVRTYVTAYHVEPYFGSSGNLNYRYPPLPHASVEIEDPGDFEFNPGTITTDDQGRARIEMLAPLGLPIDENGIVHTTVEFLIRSQGRESCVKREYSLPFASVLESSGAMVVARQGQLIEPFSIHSNDYLRPNDVIQVGNTISGSGAFVRIRYSNGKVVMLRSDNLQGMRAIVGETGKLRQITSALSLELDNLRQEVVDNPRRFGRLVIYKTLGKLAGTVVPGGAKTKWVTSTGVTHALERVMEPAYSGRSRQSVLAPGDDLEGSSLVEVDFFSDGTFLVQNAGAAHRLASANQERILPAGGAVYGGTDGQPLTAGYRLYRSTAPELPGQLLNPGFLLQSGVWWDQPTDIVSFYRLVTELIDGTKGPASAPVRAELATSAPNAAAATGSVAIESHGNGLRLSWQEAADTIAWSIERAVDSGSFTPLLQGEAVARPLFFDNALDPGRFYRYRITPLNADRMAGNASVTAAMTFEEPPLPDPTGLTARLDGHHARLRWDPADSSDVVHYRIARYVSGQFVSQATTPSDSPWFDDGPLAYRWRVSAVNSSGSDTSTQPVLVPVPELVAVVGKTFDFTLQARGTPVSFHATHLPAGLELDPTTGRISGVPVWPTLGSMPILITTANAVGSVSGIARITVHPHEPGTAHWTLESIEAAGEAGSHCALALDAAGGPWIPFFDNATESLRVVRHTGGAWTVETIDALDRAGYYPSIRFDTLGRPHLSYLAFGRSMVRHGLKSGETWLLQDVEVGMGYPGTAIALDTNHYPHISLMTPGTMNAVNPTLMSYDGAQWVRRVIVRSTEQAGLFNALDIDSANRPHLSYNNQTAARLQYATPGFAGWQVVPVDPSGPGLYTSIRADANQTPHISYFHPPTGQLRYARRAGSGWHLEVVDGTGRAGTYSSLALDALGRPHISYRDELAAALKYAYHDGERWVIQTVDDSSDTGYSSSLALDPQGVPWIAYYDLGAKRLRLARGSLPPQVGSLAPVESTAGQALDWQLPTSGLATTFTASGLPPELTLHPSLGKLSGTSAVPGRFPVEFQISNSEGVVTRRIELVIQDSMSAWSQRHFTSAQLADPNVSGPDADPDLDDRSNRLEYALGTNPWVADAEPAAVATLEDIFGGNYLVLTTLLPDPPPVDVDYEWWGGDRIDQWSISQTELLQESLDPVYALRVLVHRLTSPAQTQSQGYLQFRVRPR